MKALDFRRYNSMRLDRRKTRHEENHPEVSGFCSLSARHETISCGTIAVVPEPNNLGPNVGSDIIGWIESGSYVVEANQIATRIGMGKRPGEQDLHRMRSLWESALASARSVDPTSLNQVYAGLCDHFRDDFLPGVELRLDALVDPRRGKMAEADRLLLRWDNWYFSRQAGIKLALRKLGFPIE